MTRRTRVARVGLAFLVVSAAGCGTTLDVKTAGNGTAGQQSLTVPSTGPGGTTSGLTGPGGMSLGGPAGSGTGGGGGGPTGSNGTGTGGSSYVGGTGGGAGGGLVGPGITPTTVTVGLYYSSQSAGADKAIGAAGAAPSYNAPDVYNAVINYANKHGGFAGRQLKALYYNYNLSDDQSAQDQSACAYWTQDHKVFALPAKSDLTQTCAEKAGALSLISGASTAQSYQKYPHFIEPFGIRLDRLGSITVNGLWPAGYFTGKLGFITWEDPAFKYAYQHGYLPAFASHGIKLTDKAFVAVPQQVGAIGDMSAAMSSIVTRFRSEGIDHVIIQDGHAGVWAGGGLTLEFMDQAESQRYFPRYGQNTDNVPGSTQLPSDQQNNAIAILDTDTSPKNDAGWHTNATRQKCFQIQAAAGMPVSEKNDNDEGIAAQVCDTIFFLQRVLNAMSRSTLTADAFVNAVAGLGRTWPSAFVYGTEFKPGLRDGSAAVRKATYSASCKCLNYSGAPYYP
jgi:hypothetical protein